jgi:tetratricopeptide (TPR) repeat protein
MGIAYCDLKNYDESLQCFQSILDFNPNSASAYHCIGELYGDIGNEEKQISNYKKAAQLGLEEAKEWLQEKGHTW